MKEKPLKAPDIAKLAGISGSEMKRIAEQYDSVIPSRILGRVKLYEQKAAGIIEKISSMEAAGTAPGDIIRDFGGKVTRKSTKERTEKNIRKSQTPGEGGKRPAATSKEDIKPAPRTDTTSPRYDDRTAFLELKLAKLTNRVEKLEQELKFEKKARLQDREEFFKSIADISDNLKTTGKWIDYFDRTLDDFSARQDKFNAGTKEWIDYTEEELEFIKMPFWKKRR